MDGRTECRGTLRRRAAASSWTDERIAYVAERWSQGVTARQIAQELGGGISHSAVMGKIHRLGIAGLSPNAWAHRKRPGGDERRIPQWMVTLLVSGIPLRQRDAEDLAALERTLPTTDKIRTDDRPFAVLIAELTA